MSILSNSGCIFYREVLVVQEGLQVYFSSLEQNVFRLLGSIWCFLCSLINAVVPMLHRVLNTEMLS